MPLSEREQRLLDEMERNLYGSDSDFLRRVGRAGSRPNYRSVVLGIALGVIGIALLVFGVVRPLTIVGVAGFIVLLAGVLLALSAPRKAGPRTTKGPRVNGGSTGTFSERMTQRWERRQERGE